MFIVTSGTLNKHLFISELEHKCTIMCGKSLIFDLNQLNYVYSYTTKCSLNNLKCLISLFYFKFRV